MLGALDAVLGLPLLHGRHLVADDVVAVVHVLAPLKQLPGPLELRALFEPEVHGQGVSPAPGGRPVLGRRRRIALSHEGAGGPQCA